MEVDVSILKTMKKNKDFNGTNVMIVPAWLNLSWLEPEIEFSDVFLFNMRKSFIHHNYEYMEENRQMLFEYKWHRAIELYKKNAV